MLRIAALAAPLFFIAVLCTATIGAISTGPSAFVAAPIDHAAVRNLPLPSAPAIATAARAAYLTNDSQKQPVESTEVIHKATGVLPLSAEPPITTGSNPDAGIYDSQDQYVYVLNTLSDNVSVISGDRAIATVVVGAYPYSGVYDPADGDVYVVNTGPANVSVINRTTVESSIQIGGSPGKPAYDDSNSYVYIPNFSLNDVTLVSGSSVVATINVGMEPEGAVYDAENQYVYVSNTLSNSISVLNGSGVVATIPVGSYPGYPAFDSRDGFVYVPNENSNNISVINGTKVVASLPAGKTPSQACSDPEDGFVYATNEGSSNVTVLNGTRVVGSVSVGNDPLNPTYDNGDELVYVANALSGNVSAMAGARVVSSLAAGDHPISPTYDEGNGFLYVTNELSNNVTVFPTWFPISFTESGLPAGALWWINITGGSSFFSVNTSSNFSLGDGAYHYDFAPVNRSYSAPGGLLNVSNSAVYRSVEFTLVTFLVVFAEVGLPASTDWSISFGPMFRVTSASSMTFSGVNGTYEYRLGLVPGWTTTNFTGSVLVHGGAISKLIDWVQVTYRIGFLETGLPPSVSWEVYLGGRLANLSNANTLNLTLPNGTFFYSIHSEDSTYSATGGSFSVAGSDLTEMVTFTEVSFGITIMSVGLPAGTPWSVSVAGVTYPSTTNSIDFEEPNGTYSYSLGRVPGWAVNNLSNSFTIAGRGVAEAIVWIQVTYPVSFTELGLPSGMSWSVSLDGLRHSGSSPTITFLEGNGTYSFSVGPVSGYSATPMSGPLSVNSSGTTRSIDFAPIGSGSEGARTLLGLPQLDAFFLLIGVSAAIGLTITTLFIRRGRLKRN